MASTQAVGLHDVDTKSLDFAFFFSPRGFFPLRFLIKIFYEFLFLPIRAEIPTREVNLYLS
jgi:hypothetical protein